MLNATVMIRAIYEERTSAIVDVDWYFQHTREFISVLGTFACPSLMDAAEFERRVCSYFRRPITVHLAGRRVASPAVRIGDLIVDVTGSRLQFKHADAPHDEYFTGDMFGEEEADTTVISWELPTCREFRGSWGSIRVPRYMTLDDFRHRLRLFWGHLPLNIIGFNEDEGSFEITGPDMLVYMLPDIKLEAVDPDYRRTRLEMVADPGGTKIRIRGVPIVIGHPDTDNYVPLPHYSSRSRRRTKTVLAARSVP